MATKDEEDQRKFDLPLSQGTFNMIQNVINQTFAVSTPPEPAVIRIKKDNVCDRGISLEIPEANQSIKNIKERCKVMQYNNSKLVYIPKDARFRVKLNYDKLQTPDLYLRIYPSATDTAFKYRPIVCCGTHGRKTATKVSADMLERAAASIFEINDPDARYETIELPKNEVQISAVVKFWSPDIDLDLVVKCYNTCHEEFKKSYPKLNFSIEQLIEQPTKQYRVLCEKSIFFKVCASPARDSKSMSLRKRPAVEDSAVSVKLEDKSGPFYWVFNGMKYFPKLVPEPMVGAIDFVAEYSRPHEYRELLTIEQMMVHSLASVVSSRAAAPNGNGGPKMPKDD